jgi:acyl carrier protein
MLPSAFVVLEAMPRTPNGKLDRHALPAPERAAYGSRAFEPPEGDIEEALASIWGGLLRIDRVGRNDNFFELGGHSLLTLKALAQMAERFAIEPPQITLFRYPTVREMAEVITRLLDVEEGVL